ncbi:TerB family tellurite resistance protein [Chryseolinea sp. T2]|uniref:tellurite resistance TerB family protein n=1 Tax=Chryseolinea sp. T2 TaxID=3129255 RepID=UPI0030775140
MSFKSIIIRLYYMLIHCDGKVNEGEIALGKRMMEAEQISEAEFDRLVTALQDRDLAALYKECIVELKRLPKPLQIRCIAWLCVLANADGFMDRAEWQFIYKIYHRELQLPLDVIMGVQKELMRKVNAVIIEQIAPNLSNPRLALF